MILYIDPVNRDNYRNYIKQYYKLRKRVFCDDREWVTPNPDGTETDHLDDEFGVYILHVDSKSDALIGGLRLNPSTGKTLMHSVWSDMLPDPNDFRSPNIWEVTRFCVDERMNNGRGASFVNRTFLALMLALLDFSHANGISTLMAVCEERFLQPFSAFNGGPEVIASKTEADGCRISFVVWETDEALRQAFEWARPYLGGSRPIKLDAA